MTSYCFNQFKLWCVNNNFHLLFLLPQLWKVFLMHLRSHNSTDSTSYLGSESLLRHDRALSHKYAPSIVIIHIVLFLKLSSDSCYKWIGAFSVQSFSLFFLFRSLIKHLQTFSLTVSFNQSLFSLSIINYLLLIDYGCLNHIKCLK